MLHIVKNHGSGTDHVINRYGVMKIGQQLNRKPGAMEAGVVVAKVAHARNISHVSHP